MTLKSSNNESRSLGTFFTRVKYFVFSSGVTVILLYFANTSRGVSDYIKFESEIYL